MTSALPARYRLGVDTGRTFTDVVLLDEPTGAVHIFKLPSTPSNPALAVLQGIARALGAVPPLPHPPPHGGEGTELPLPLGEGWGEGRTGPLPPGGGGL